MVNLRLSHLWSDYLGWHRLGFGQLAGQELLPPWGTPLRSWLFALSDLASLRAELGNSSFGFRRTPNSVAPDSHDFPKS